MTGAPASKEEAKEHVRPRPLIRRACWVAYGACCLGAGLAAFAFDALLFDSNLVRALFAAASMLLFLLLTFPVRRKMVT